MTGYRPSLQQRLATLSMERPEEVRGQVLEAMREAVPAHMGVFFTCATDANGQRYFTKATFCGDDEDLIGRCAGLAEAPAFETPWLPPRTDPSTLNTFIRLKARYTDQYLLSFDIHRNFYYPLEVGDQLRTVLFDGSRFLGWIGLMRRGADERFGEAEERALEAALGLIKAALVAAEALESKLLDGGVFGVATATGHIDHASPSFGRWLNSERRDYLQRRIRAIDGGRRECGVELFAGAEVRIVRLDGSGGVRYLMTVDEAAILELGPLAGLTERQQEIAEYAAVGATTAEIARAVGISPHTVKFHLKQIYERLGVASRLELAELVARSVS